MKKGKKHTANVRARIILLAFCIVFAQNANANNSGEKDYELGVTSNGLFVDVEYNSWYSDAIQYMYEHNLMNGVGNNRFAPNGTVTRGMLVTILHRLDGADETVEKSAFEDVPAGSYYKDAVDWAAAHGIVDGYSQKRFGSNDNVTREQLATILYRYSMYKGYDVTKESTLAVYADSKEISRYALKAMRWSVAMGIISGLSETQLGPSLSATRAQVSAMVMRFDRLFSSEIFVNDKTPKDSSVVHPSRTLSPNQAGAITTDDAGVATLAVERVVAKAGDKDVTVSVHIKNNPGILGMTLTVSYDEQNLKLINAKNGSAVSEVLTFVPAKFLKSGSSFVWYGTDLNEKQIKDGTVLTLTFEVAEDAKGMIPIVLTVADGDIIDNRLQTVNMSLQNGSILVK